MTDEPLRVRAPVVRIVDHRASTTVIGPQIARRFDGDSAALLRAVLDIHIRPVGRTQLLAELAARAGLAPTDLSTSASAIEPNAPVPAGPSAPTATERHAPTIAEHNGLPTRPIDDLVELLVNDGILIAAREPPPSLPVTALRRVVLGISGAVAAADAPALIRGMQAAGCDVRVALTRNAARLVSRAALDALTHHAVWSALWQRDARMPVPHIGLAEWAELVVVCPASATTLARIATGDCSDLVAAIVTATRAPVVVVPSMNDAMYASPAVQANLATLRDHGRHVVHPALGVEVAHPPHARTPLLGPAPPAAAIVDIVRHLLAQLAAPPRLPDSAHAWEQLWSTTPVDKLPWHATALEPPVADAIAARRAPGRRLLDLGTGDGVVAVAAAQHGFRVTALDIAPTALGRARDRADRAHARSILFVLDDVTAPQLDGAYDIAVDRGLLHSLPRDSWPAYATTVTRLVSPGGALLVVAHAPAAHAPAAHAPTAHTLAAHAPAAHAPAAPLCTYPVTPQDLSTLLPAFALVHTVPTTLAHAPALLFELERRAASL